MGLTEMSLEDAMSTLMIDVKVRKANPLDEVIEPEIGRKFGVLVSEDDFSAEGAIEYRPPMVDGKETNLKEFASNLNAMAKLIEWAAKVRDSKL